MLINNQQNYINETIAAKTITILQISIPVYRKRSHKEFRNRSNYGSDNIDTMQQTKVYNYSFYILNQLNIVD